MYFLFDFVQIITEFVKEQVFISGNSFLESQDKEGSDQ
jgi:hypothetical protein